MTEDPSSSTNSEPIQITEEHANIHFEMNDFINTPDDEPGLQVNVETGTTVWTEVSLPDETFPVEPESPARDYYFTVMMKKNAEHLASFEDTIDK